jgi:hypothetical protein
VAQDGDFAMAVGKNHIVKAGHETIVRGRFDEPSSPARDLITGGLQSGQSGYLSAAGRPLPAPARIRRVRPPLTSPHRANPIVRMSNKVTVATTTSADRLPPRQTELSAYRCRYSLGRLAS